MRELCNPGRMAFANAISEINATGSIIMSIPMSIPERLRIEYPNNESHDLVTGSRALTCSPVHDTTSRSDWDNGGNLNPISGDANVQGDSCSVDCDQDSTNGNIIGVPREHMPPGQAKSCVGGDGSLGPHAKRQKVTAGSCGNANADASGDGALRSTVVDSEFFEYWSAGSNGVDDCFRDYGSADASGNGALRSTVMDSEFFKHWSAGSNGVDDCFRDWRGSNGDDAFFRAWCAGVNGIDDILVNRVGDF